MPLFEQNKEKTIVFSSNWRSRQIPTEPSSDNFEYDMLSKLFVFAWSETVDSCWQVLVNTEKRWSATADAGVWIILHLVLQYGRLCIFEVFSFLLFDQVPEKEERCTNMVEIIKQHRLDVECCTPSVSWTVLEWALISRFVLCHVVAFFSRPACLQALVLHIGNSGSSTFNLGPFTVP